MLDPDPLAVVNKICLSVSNIGLIERLAEILQDGIVNFEVLCGMMSHDIALRKVEECVVLQQRVLKVVALDRRNSDIGCNAPPPP